ncbi:MAG: hypothetical protein JJU41_05995 [Bacteroidetes bacterium]|nr:hypothetical protein [Bacteroidota bacterium]MCH8523049.1 hypothetical protein [Balneolales bacterium]
MSFVRVIIFGFFLFPSLLLAQPAKVGTHIDARSGIAEAVDLPFHFFLIDGILPASDINTVKETGKPLWLSSGLQFIRGFDLKHHTDSLSTAITDPVVFYRRAGLSIHTYILAYHPLASEKTLDFLNTKHDESPLAESSRGAIVTTPKASERLSPSTFHHILAIDELRDMESLPFASTVYIIPGMLDQSPALQLRSVLQQAIEQRHEIIIPFSYVQHLQRKDQRIFPLIAEFTTQDNPIFALSDVEETRPYVSITIMALLICWLVFGMFFFGNGHYHRALSRYVFTHNFYVNDVMNRRLKTENDVPISIFVISLFFGLFLMALTQALDTHLIFSSLYMHAPNLYAVMFNEFIVFGIGFAISISLILLGTIWLFVAAGGRVSPGQILQLYVYPLHIVVLAATLMAVLQLNQVHGSIHLLISGFTLIILGASVIIAAADIAPYQQQIRKKFNIVGPVMYSLTIIAILTYLIVQTPLTDNLMLLVQLLD